MGIVNNNNKLSSYYFDIDNVVCSQQLLQYMACIDMYNVQQ